MSFRAGKPPGKPPGKPHVGDCPHLPEDRIRGGDPFKGYYQHGCGLCKLRGQVKGSPEEAAKSFDVAVNRERKKRSTSFYEDTHLDSIENLMKKPPDSYMSRARRLS